MSFCYSNPSSLREGLFDNNPWNYSEKAMAPHSSTLAWKIPWMEEPGRLHSMRLLRVGHSLFTFTHWRRKCQPTPVLLPGESQEWGSLVGCHLWGHTESDMTEATQQQQATEQEQSMCLSFCQYHMVLITITL